MDTLHRGDILSAVQFLTLLESEDEETVEDAFRDLEALGVTLDISDLPADSGDGDAALRLRTEMQLVQQNKLPEGLDANDPLRLYLEELASVPAWGDPQVLALECAEGKEDAQAMLVNISLHRVVELAKEMVGKGVLLLDLIQEGSLGLWQSVLEYKSGDLKPTVIGGSGSIWQRPLPCRPVPAVLDKKCAGRQRITAVWTSGC